MEKPLADEVVELQKLLGKKATFEGAVKKLTVLVTSRYQRAALEEQRTMDAAIARAATLLQTRYSGESSRGFWLAGSKLFEAATNVSSAQDQKRKLQTYITKARDFLGEDELSTRAATPVRPEANFLFEGQLSSDPPPLRSTDAQVLLSSMFGQFMGGEEAFIDVTESRDRDSEAEGSREEQATSTEASRRQEAEQSTTNEVQPDAVMASIPEPPVSGRVEPPPGSQPPVEEDPDTPSTSGTELELPDWAEALRAPNGGLFEQLQGNVPLDRPSIQGALQRLQEIILAGNSGMFPGLEDALQASLEDAGQRNKQRPAAAKDEVERLPIMDVDEAKLKHFGDGTQCAVCREDLVLGDQVQQMPCNHLFHPPCLAPWLEENNSCPICRFELRTDDNEYERRKEREQQEEEDRKGAANAVREGQFMYM